MVAAGVQLERGADALLTVKSADGLGVLLHRLEHRVPRFALPVTQGETDAVRPAQGRVGEHILPKPGEPEGAGHAGRPGERVRAIEGVYREQPRQGVSRDAAPAGRAGQLPLGGGQYFFRQKPQIVVGAAGEGRGVFEHRRAVPGGHVPVPVQSADRHQGQRRGGGQSVKDLLSLLAEGVQIHHRRVRLGGGENGHSLAAGSECVHGAASFLFTVRRSRAAVPPVPSQTPHPAPSCAWRAASGACRTEGACCSASGVPAARR